MTAVYIRPVGYDRYCRLLTIGVVHHVTACGAKIDATDAVILTATRPSPELGCSVCRADADLKRARCATIDLRPGVREVRLTADLTVDADDAPGPDSAAIRSALDEQEDLLEVPVAGERGA